MCLGSSGDDRGVDARFRGCSPHATRRWWIAASLLEDSSSGPPHFVLIP